MTNRDELFRSFLEILENKVPEKAKLVDLLMEILFIEKGAVNRRLRGEVPFSSYEVAIIAKKLDISLNSLINKGIVPTEHYELNLIEYSNMSENDYKHWEDYNAMINETKDDPNSEMVESSNVLPLSIYAGFDSLQKFYLFKYQYLFLGTENRVTFGDLALTERLSRIYKSYFNVTKNFATTIYIWDYLIFQYLVTDIRFFSSVNLISEDEVRQIKTDLFALVEYVEEFTWSGFFKETGRLVYLYIADINLDADYSCLKFNNLYLSHLRAFVLNSVVSSDPSTYIKLRDCIFSHKKCSTLITRSGAIYRADFFEKQRTIISAL